MPSAATRSVRETHGNRSDEAIPVLQRRCRRSDGDESAGAGHDRRAGLRDRVDGILCWIFMSSPGKTNENTTRARTNVECTAIRLAGHIP
jgi:hypothetical protein